MVRDCLRKRPASKYGSSARSDVFFKTVALAPNETLKSTAKQFVVPSGVCDGAGGFVGLCGEPSGSAGGDSSA